MIDFNRDYSTICGTFNIPGARYEQDGKYYGPKGNEINVDYHAEAKKLKEHGLSDTEIGDQLGITRQKVTKILCG